MAFVTALIFNISTGQLILSAVQPSPVANPIWYYGDTKHLNIQFVQNGATQGTVSILPSAGIGLAIGAGTPGSTPLTTATASGPDANGIFTADLSMTTSLITTAIANGQIECVLELRTSDGTNFQRYELPLVIKPSLLSGTITATPPPDTAIGVNAAKATFVSKDGAAGDFQIMRSPDGTKKCRFYWGNDGVEHFDPIT